MNAASANQPDQPHPRVALLPRRVHTITDRFSMTNTYLIHENRLIVVDPSSALNARLLLDYLQTFLQRRPADIDLIALTHPHPDHIAGVQVLRRACNAPVAASAAIRLVAEESQQRVLSQTTASAPHFANYVLPWTQQTAVFSPLYTQQAKMIDLWLDDVAGLPSHPDWRVIASSGRTSESLCLYNPFTGELLCGDTVITVAGGIPRLRHATNRSQLEEMLRILRGLTVHYLYPGHGRQIVGETPLSNARLE